MIYFIESHMIFAPHAYKFSSKVLILMQGRQSCHWLHIISLASSAYFILFSISKFLFNRIWKWKEKACWRQQPVNRDKTWFCFDVSQFKLRSMYWCLPVIAVAVRPSVLQDSRNCLTCSRQLQILPLIFRVVFVKKCQFCQLKPLCCAVDNIIKIVCCCYVWFILPSMVKD